MRCFLVILLCLTFAPIASAAEKPNVLFISIDDLNDWVGPLGGHPQVKTPHIDALAARGTTFTNAHCQAPLCNPSRTSILTGLRPSTTGVYALAPWFRTTDKLKDHATLFQWFKKNGYTTISTGKIFHGGYPPKADRAKEVDVWGRTATFNRGQRRSSSKHPTRTRSSIGACFPRRMKIVSITTSRHGR